MASLADVKPESRVRVAFDSKTGLYVLVDKERRNLVKADWDVATQDVSIHAPVRNPGNRTRAEVGFGSLTGLTYGTACASRYVDGFPSGEGATVGYTMERDYIPATMPEARKRWRTHTRHVLTDDLARAIKRDGECWNEDGRGPFVQVEDIKLRFWKRRTCTGAEHVYCGIAVR